MKTHWFHWLLSLVIILGVAVPESQAQKKTSKKNKKEVQFENMVQLIESGTYEFVANKANPQSGRQVDLTTNPNHLRVMPDIIDAYLPFFGRSYVSHYQSEGGIKFREKPLTYKVIKNEKKYSIAIELSVKTKDDLYSMRLDVSRSGYGTLNVNSNNRANISYYGEIIKGKEKGEKKKKTE